MRQVVDILDGLEDRGSVNCVTAGGDDVHKCRSDDLF